MSHDDQTELPRLPVPPELHRPPGTERGDPALHAAMARWIEVARDHRTTLAAAGRDTAIPLVIALDAAGEIMLGVFVLPHPDVRAEPRDHALAVVERVARGLNPPKILMIMDVYHRTGDSTHVVGRHSMHTAHAEGRAGAEGVSEAMSIYAVTRDGTVTATHIPYEWDRSKRAEGLTWHRDAEASGPITAPGDDPVKGGLIPEVLVEHMRKPLYAADAQFIKLAVESAGEIGADAEVIRRLVARETVAMLTVRLHCACQTPNIPDFDGIQEFVYMRQGQFEELTKPMTPDRMKAIVEQIAKEAAGRQASSERFRGFRRRDLEPPDGRPRGRGVNRPPQ